jgi:RNA polymerase sigma-70 factor (ECF subfamily)
LPVAEDGRDEWEAQRKLDAIERVVATLSLRQRSVFILKYRQGLKLQQVAEAMAISLGTVKALHHRAIHRLRRELASGCGGENEHMS